MESPVRECECRRRRRWGLWIIKTEISSPPPSHTRVTLSACVCVSADTALPPRPPRPPDVTGNSFRDANRFWNYIRVILFYKWWSPVGIHYPEDQRAVIGMTRVVDLGRRRLRERAIRRLRINNIAPGKREIKIILLIRAVRGRGRRIRKPPRSAIRDSGARRKKKWYYSNSYSKIVHDIMCIFFFFSLNESSAV